MLPGSCDWPLSCCQHLPLPITFDLLTNPADPNSSYCCSLCGPPAVRYRKNQSQAAFNFGVLDAHVLSSETALKIDGDNDNCRRRSILPVWCGLRHGHWFPVSLGRKRKLPSLLDFAICVDCFRNITPLSQSGSFTSAMLMKPRGKAQQVCS